jgi:integrase
MKKSSIKPSTPLSTLAKAFLAWKVRLGASRAYLSIVSNSLRALIRETGDVSIEEVTPAGVQHALAFYAPATANRAFQVYKCFFDWSQGRGLQPNPMRGLARPPGPPPTPTGPYTAAEVRGILGALREPLDGVVAALAAFADLRPGEILHINRDVQLLDRSITVRSRKDRSIRRIEITPVLQSWLALLRARPGPVLAKLPTPAAVVRRAMLQGLRVRFHRLRLAFMAYRFAITGSQARVAQEAGIAHPVHRYIACPGVAKAKTFWRLTPERCGRKDWNA